MAEKIRIVLTRQHDDMRQELSLMPGESFFRMLVSQGYFEGMHCGGLGRCGKCKARFVEGASMPTPADRKLLSPEELREGYRLLCRATITKDCVIELPAQNKVEVLALAPEEFLKELEPVDEDFVICDLGTTTIVLMHVQGRSHSAKGTYKALNPQRAFGSDVIRRMELAQQGEDLKTPVINAIKEGLSELGVTDKPIYLSGNTAMIYLLLGYDTKCLEEAPFVMDQKIEGDFEVDGLRLKITPALSAFVGGDIYAGLQGLLTAKSDRPFLLIDLGTNGEMALVTKNQIIATATAAGPAFEGMATAGIWGADLISIVADMYPLHIVDAYGTLAEPYEKGYHAGEVCIKQEDIRALQLAKAAIRAGIEELLAQAGIEETDDLQVYLAGGFGYYINPEKAAMLGILPERLAKNATAVGNASLWGTYLRALTNNCSEQIEQEINKTRVINLANSQNFNEKYLNYINFS